MTDEEYKYFLYGVMDAVNDALHDLENPDTPGSSFGYILDVQDLNEGKTVVDGIKSVIKDLITEGVSYTVDLVQASDVEGNIIHLTVINLFDTFLKSTVLEYIKYRNIATMPVIATGIVDKDDVCNNLVATMSECAFNLLCDFVSTRYVEIKFDKGINITFCSKFLDALLEDTILKYYIPDSTKNKLYIYREDSEEIKFILNRSTFRLVKGC